MPTLHVPAAMQTLLKLRFDTFHAANPWVWREYERYALKLAVRGVKRYGSKTIYEHLRYVHDLQTESDDGLKLNNNYTPYYARLFKQEHPEYGEFFAFRRVKGETDDSIPKNVHIV